MSPFLLRLLQSTVTKKVAKELTKAVASKQKSSLLFLVKTTYKAQLKELVALEKAKSKPSLREQWRRVAKWKNIKGAFRTLSWKYLKEEFQYVLKQYRALKHRRYGEVFRTSNKTPAWENARKTEFVFSFDLFYSFFFDFPIDPRRIASELSGQLSRE